VYDDISDKINYFLKISVSHRQTVFIWYRISAREPNCLDNNECFFMITVLFHNRTEILLQFIESYINGMIIASEVVKTKSQM